MEEEGEVLEGFAKMEGKVKCVGRVDEALKLLLEI